MTDICKRKLDDLDHEVWKIKQKLIEITKEEKQYADSLDEEDEYFQRKFAEETVEILEEAKTLCDRLSDKMSEAQG